MLRPDKTSLVTTILTLAGMFTLGAIAPSQALETAQASGSEDSSGLELSDPETSGEQSADDDVEQSTTSSKSAPLTLERPNADPLLPGKVNGRALTAQEQERLRLGLERLKVEANASYAGGDRPTAYRKFFRILSLSQYLPAPEELGSLTRIGRIAWQDSQAEEAQTIAARVRQLEADAGEKVSPAQRQSLAEAYESLGAWDNAIAHYDPLLALEQPNGEKETSSGSNPTVAVVPNENQSSLLSETILINRLARLSLFRFDYPAAALYTEQAILLTPEPETASTTTGTASPNLSSNLPATDSQNADLQDLKSPLPVLPLPSETAPAQTSTDLLNQLAYVYEQDQRFAEAAAVQQQIFPLYNEPLFVSRQPALQVAIAQNQARSGQLVEAIASYQAAYGQSQALQQFAVSKAALSQLAELYRGQGQPDDALSVYDILLQVHDLSYNLYGIADTQASRAEILLEQQQIDQARQAYRQAIYAARLLGYREAELQQRLEALPQP